MKAFKKKFQELVYSFSTEDRYADYDEEAAHPNVAAEVERSISHSNHGSQIQLADYVDGSNPSGNEGISEALLAWRHIDNWTEEHNPDLAATLSDPCTRHDINNAEKDLDIIFPSICESNPKNSRRSRGFGVYDWYWWVALWVAINVLGPNCSNEQDLEKRRRKSTT